jgi:hypothetical protein
MRPQITAKNITLKQGKNKKLSNFAFIFSLHPIA